MTPGEVDHEMVRRHELEVVEENFTRWVMAFGCILCMLIPVSVGLLVYLTYSYIIERNMECDVPLKEWYLVSAVNIIYHVNLKGKSIHQQVIRLVCRYEAMRQRMEPPPIRVRLYHFLISGFCFAWHCLGLEWVRTSETCHETAPHLFKAVHMFAAFNVIFTVFTAISTLGLSRMLASLMRRGLLPPGILNQDRVAPEGTLERQESVDLDQCPDAAQCPTCLEDFTKDLKIKRTICGHLFHEDCLAAWLRVNRTCPLCRADLCPDSEVIGAPMTDGAPDEEDNSAATEADVATTLEAGQASQRPTPPPAPQPAPPPAPPPGGPPILGDAVEASAGGPPSPDGGRGPSVAEAAVAPETVTTVPL